MSRAVRLWLGAFPAVLALAGAAAAVIATSDHESHPAVIAVVFPAIALSFAVSGLVAWTLRPDNGTGRLLVLVGVLWLVSSFWESDHQAVFTIGNVFGSLFLAAFVHLLLAFPEGRLSTDAERRLIVGLWATALLANLIPGFFARRLDSCKDCPDNPLAIVDHENVANALNAVFSAVGLVIFAGVVVLVIRRWRRASEAQRRILGPVYLSGGLAAGFVGLLFAAGFVSGPWKGVLAVAAFTTFGTVPLLFLAGLLRTRLTRAAARLLREVPDDPTPAQIEAGFRSVLGDPTLVLLMWHEDIDGYVDAGGRRATVPRGTPRRVATPIEYEGRPLAMIVHDAALLHQQALLDEVVSAARIAMEKDRGIQALRRSEQRNSALLDAIPDLIFTLARDGTYLDVRADPAVLVVPREQLIGANVRDVLPWEIAERFAEALAMPASRGVQTTEYRLVIDGVERDFEARMVPSGEDEVVVIVRDFTERSQLEEELARRLREVQHEQEFNRTVVNTAPIVLMICDEQGGIVRFNDTTERVFGHPDDERIRGRRLWDAFVTEADRGAVERAFHQVHPLRPVEIQARWVTDGGVERVIDASIAHIIDGEGVHRRVVAGLDVTDLIAQREAATQQRDFLAVVAAATPSLLAVVDADGTVAAEGVNRAFAHATGYDDDTATGKRFWDLVVPPELVDEFVADFEGAVRAGATADHETAWIGASGEWRLVEWSCRPLPKIGKFLICGVDITDRKRHEEELRASRARLVEAGDSERRRLERNLHDGAQQRLVSVSLALRLAQARLHDDPEGADQLLAGAAGELTQAIDELRELARGIHPAVLTDRGLPAALETLASRAPLPVELSAGLDGTLPGPVEAALYYVVAEALTNVAKYADASTVRVRAGQQNGHVLVEVVDDGVGGADPARGSGLRGLADRVEALDGRLEVESAVGGGTTVRAVIPLAGS